MDLARGGVALERGGVARTSNETSDRGVPGLLMLGVAGELLWRESVRLISSSAMIPFAEINEFFLTIKLPTMHIGKIFTEKNNVF